jgi:hypothetical protein
VKRPTDGSLEDELQAKRTKLDPAEATEPSSSAFGEGGGAFQVK